MALQAIKHGLAFPNYPDSFLLSPSLGSSAFVIDAAAEKAAFIFAASAAKSIRKVHIRTGTVTTGDTVDVRIETVDNAANGDPTGSLWAANTNAALVIASGDDNVWKTATLTADAAVAIGDIVAIVVVNGGGGGNMQFINYADQIGGFPFGDLFTASWAKSASMPMFAIEYSDGSFEPVFGYPDQGALINTTTFNSGSGTNRRGNIFQLAFPSRAKGCWVCVDADGDFSVKLYDSDGTTVLATTATHSTFQRQTLNNIFFLPFLAPADLSAATSYRLAVVPGGSNVSTFDFDVPAAGMLDMFPGGQSCHASVFTGAAWVETTTRRGFLGVFLDAFDDGAGGGGGGHIIGGGF